MRLYEELETGVECERLAPTLHALAYGTADSEALLELRPHLRNCAGCRATVRALHASRLRRLTAFAPIAALLAAGAGVGRAAAGTRGADAPALGELHPIERQQDVDELFRRSTAPSPPSSRSRPRSPRGVGRLSTARINLRGWVETALHRLQSSDLAIGVHAASTAAEADHLDRGPDRDLHQRRRSGDLLRRDGAPARPEAGDPERGEDREAQGRHQ